MIELKTHDPPQKRWGMDEKTWVAFSSVIAAIILTGTKLVVGIWSHSLVSFPKPFIPLLILLRLR